MNDMLRQTGRPVTVKQLEPFWRCADRYGPDALAGKFAAESLRQGTAEKFVCAISKIICDGQNASMAYAILSSFRDNEGPMTARDMHVEFEFDHLEARRAASVPFYILAPASRIDQILPLEKSGKHNPPLPARDAGPLQKAVEAMISPSARPSYSPAQPAFWLGDLCEKAIGLSTRAAQSLPAAGVFGREHAVFLSTDKGLIDQLSEISQKFYPAPIVAVTPAVQAPAQATPLVVAAASAPVPVPA